MKTNVRVAVIGGGVVGCSVLFHLTKLGWKDVVLIERDELTSGSTCYRSGRDAHAQQRPERLQARRLTR